MGKLTNEKNSISMKAQKEIINEAIKRLEYVFELKEQGKEDESNIARDDVMNWIDGLIHEMEKNSGPKEPSAVERSSLPQSGEVIAQGEKIILSVIREDEKDKYMAVSYEHSYIKGCYKDEKFVESVWNDFLVDSAFVCSIYDKESKKYVGYCSVKNLVKKDWELAIELNSKDCHKGYGLEALKLFMKTLYKLTGRRYYRTRVEIDNYASQGLMKKLNAIPNGISEFMIYGEEIKRFQTENRDMITDEIREVASEFCMEAEDILGYVLEYRLDVENI